MTNRITDVLQKLEKGKPLATQFAGASTAGQTQYSDDPRSTWGFDFLGQAPKTKEPKPCFDSYVVRLLTQLTTCQYNAAWHCLAHYESAQPDIRLVSEDSFWAIQVKQAESPWIYGEQSSATLTSCTIPYPYFQLWGTKAERIAVASHAAWTTVVPVETEHLQAAEVNLSDYFDPPSLEWNESDYKAAEAARKFSEDLYADH